MSTSKKLNVTDVISKIKEASVGRAMLNAVPTGTELTYVEANTREDGETYVTLKAKKGGKKYHMHVNAFAAMRIADKATDITEDWSSELSRSTKVTNLQDYVLAEDDFTLDDNIVFKIIKRVPIEDTFRKGKAQMEVNCYKNFQEFIESNAETRANTSLTANERSAAYQATRTLLYKSGIADGVDESDEKRHQFVPVFSIK